MKLYIIYTSGVLPTKKSSNSIASSFRDKNKSRNVYELEIVAINRSKRNIDKFIKSHKNDYFFYYLNDKFEYEEADNVIEFVNVYDLASQIKSVLIKSEYGFLYPTYSIVQNPYHKKRHEPKLELHAHNSRYYEYLLYDVPVYHTLVEANLALEKALNKLKSRWS